MAALTGQYTEIPGEINSEKESDSTPESKNITKIIYAAIGMVVLIIIYFVFFSGGGHSINEDSSGDFESPSTGDALAGDAAKNSTSTKPKTENSCSPPKNCFTNPSVCKCDTGEYCSNETKDCQKAVCGNGKCEPKEYVDTCCEDCGCADNGCQVCNSSSHVCDNSESKISDDQAISAVENYLQDKGIAFENISVKGSFCLDSKSSKSVLVDIDSLQEKEYLVSDSGQVTEYLII